MATGRCRQAHGAVRAAGERQVLVLDDTLGIEELPDAEAVAARAGARRVVEGEQARLELGQRVAADVAGEAVGEDEFFGLRIVHESDTGDAVGEADMYRLLEDYKKESGATFLMITHDWHAAHHHADYVLLLNQKQISFGPPDEALHEHNIRLAFGHIGHEHPLNTWIDRHA